jgi:hypothetical protein
MDLFLKKFSNNWAAPHGLIIGTAQKQELVLGKFAPSTCHEMVMAGDVGCAV